MNELTKNKAITIIDRWALFFFACLIFFIPISSAAIESIFGFIFLCFLAKAYLLRPGAKAIKIFFSDKVNLSLLVFYISIGISVIAAGPLWQRALKAWFFKWGEGVLLFYFAQVLLKKKDLSILAVVMLASGFLLGIDGIYQKITGFDFLRNLPITRGSHGVVGVSASFDHYNSFAAYLVAIFFIIMGFAAKVKNIAFKAATFSVLALIMINLFFTYSRGAWITFLTVNFSLLFFLPTKKKKIMAGIFLFFFLIVIFSIPSFWQRFLFIFQSGGDADRFKIWRVAFEMFKDKPLFGQGLGSFMFLFRDYTPKLMIQYAHNCYLQMLAETGILGLLSFFWFLAELSYRAYRSFKEKPDSILIGLFAAFLAFLVHMLFDVHLYSLSLATLFWMVVGFIKVYSKQLSSYK